MNMKTTLKSVVAVTTLCLLMLCPAVARAQGGVPLWTNYYNGPVNGYDNASAIAVDSNGNVFVTGDSYLDSVTVAYSGAGAALWTNIIPNSAGRAIAVTQGGDIIVTGGSATRAYSSAGVPLWTNLSGGAAIALDSSGNVF